MVLVPAQDRINRVAWSSRSARRWFGLLSDWTDPGEAAAIAWIADEVRNQPLLDVGVGGGRTVPMLTAISADYTAVDYTPELVSVCRENHPGAHVFHMDARDMSAFSDNSFALVMFSFNGIDAVDYEGRMAILREFVRVLRPGGIALFSTHNLHGPSYRENLGRFVRMPERGAGPVDYGIDAIRVAYSFPIAAFNYWRYSRLNREFDGYALRVCAAHKFGILIMYTAFETQCAQLESVGMTTKAVFGNTSAQPLNPADDSSGEYWFHFVAQKQ